MDRQGGKPDCRSVHAGYDAAGKPITSSDELFERVYWLDHEEWWEPDGNNGLTFKDGTPQRVIDSFNLWKSGKSHGGPVSPSSSKPRP